MSQHYPDTSIEHVEARLRADAMVLRRSAPEGLRPAVMARIRGEPRPSPSAAPRPRRLLALAGLAAAALVLALLRGTAPAPETVDGAADGPGAIQRLASLLEASRARHAPARAGNELERPLLAELEALGQDTARAAATLARELPGPVGRLFGGG